MAYKQLYVRAAWGARAETPKELAARFLRMIDALEEIDPAFSNWACHYRHPKNFEWLRDRFAEEIAANAVRDGQGTPLPELGYLFGAYSRDEPEGRSFIIDCHAGATFKQPFANETTLSTFGSGNPDPDVVNYRTIRAALLAITGAWEPVKTAAFSNQLFELNRRATYFPMVWIQYLCPWLAQKFSPPSTALVEPLPNGGLLMSAATENFDVKNPKHLAVARDMAAAMAPLDKLFWSSEA
jgi:hypothetical protein